MSELSLRFDLDKLLEMADGVDPSNNISETTIILCLGLLTSWPMERWAWRNNGQPLTDAEWSIACALVSRACAELASN